MLSNTSLWVGSCTTGKKGLNYTFELSATKHFISDKVLGSSKTAYLKNKLFPIIGHRITKSDGKYLGCDFEEEDNTTV